MAPGEIPAPHDPDAHHRPRPTQTVDPQSGTSRQGRAERRRAGRHPERPAGTRVPFAVADAGPALIREATKPQHRLGAYVVLAIVTGLRTEELRKLRWSDVDLRAKTVYVLRADRHGEETKTPLSRRGLGLADIAVTALSTLRKTQAAERLSMGELYRNDDLLFCHEDGRPYTNVEVRTRFRRITAAAGIGEDWNPRELRHTFVSLLSDHGLATQKISDLVGHKHTGITETVYRHQLRPEIRDGAEHMNQILKVNEEKSA